MYLSVSVLNYILIHEMSPILIHDPMDSSSHLSLLIHKLQLQQENLDLIDQLQYAYTHRGFFCSWGNKFITQSHCVLLDLTISTDFQSYLVEHLFPLFHSVKLFYTFTVQSLCYRYVWRYHLLRLEQSREERFFFFFCKSRATDWCMLNWKYLLAIKGKCQVDGQKIMSTICLVCEFQIFSLGWCPSFIFYYDIYNYIFSFSN